MQDLAEDALQVGEQCVSHAEAPRIVIAGTSKSTETLLEQEYQRSTAKEYVITCASCKYKQILGRENINPNGLICVKCQKKLRGKGTWSAKYPGNTYADGYTISQLMNPSMCPTDLFQKLQNYPAAVFDNEVLGLPNGTTQQAIMMEDIRNCAASSPMIRSSDQVKRGFRRQLVAGVDWGGGGSGASRTVATIGVFHDETFIVLSMRSFQAFDGERDKLIEEVARYLRPFQPRLVGADEGGVGRIFNSLLQKQMSVEILSVLYCGGDNAVRSEIETIGNTDGRAKRRLSINKNIFVSQMIEYFQCCKVRLPEMDHMKPFCNDFLAVQLVVGENGKSQYSKQRHRSDDAFDSLVYAFVAGRLLRQNR